jgi:hypothetical protein
MGRSGACLRRQGCYLLFFDFDGLAVAKIRRAFYNNGITGG